MMLEDSPTFSLSPQEEEKLHALLNDLPTAEPPADLTDRIMAAVAAEDAKAKVIALPKRKPSHRWRSLASLAAVLALALMGTWSLQGSQVAVPSATPTAQGEPEIASYSMEEARRAVAPEDGAEAATNAVAEPQVVLDNKTPVDTFPELSEVLTPQAALERLVQGWHWLEPGGVASAVTADYSDTEEIFCRIRLTDGANTVTEGVMTYTHSDEEGYHFEWRENDTLSCLFTVTPDGAILTATPPMDPSDLQN